jgi:hypothetical protein
MGRRILAESTTQTSDGDFQIAFVDGDMRPGGFEELFLGDELAFLAGERQKDIHCTTTEADLITAAEQFAMSKGQAKRTEFHDLA